MTATLHDLFATLTPCETPASGRASPLFRPPAAGPPTPPPALLGDYRLLAPLASGGMGELFIACRRDLGCDELVPLAELVVVKRVLPHLAKDEHLATMFRDEARLAAQLRHGNVCRVLEVGQARGGWFLVLEYLHGVALSRLLRQLARQRQRLDVRAAIGLLIQACAGLQYAHDARGEDGRPLGIVHRDVSPPNILLTTAGTVKLLDFGIAKAASASTKTRTGTLKGKNAYMAPEQIVGGVIDRRTDVFALGIVLYELLAGDRLFQRDNDFLTFKAITEEPLPDIRERRPELSNALAQVLQRALARSPAQRYASATELASALVAASRRLGGPATADELGWCLDREFGEEIAERDAVLHRARRAALHVTLVTASGTPPPLPPAMAASSVLHEVTEDDLVAWSPAPPPLVSPSATPAWFVISEPEMENVMRFPRNSGLWRSPMRLKALAVSAAITAVLGGAALWHLRDDGGGCPAVAASVPAAAVAPVIAPAVVPACAAEVAPRPEPPHPPPASRRRPARVRPREAAPAPVAEPIAVPLATPEPAALPASPPPPVEAPAAPEPAPPVEPPAAPEPAPVPAPDPDAVAL